MSSNGKPFVTATLRCATEDEPMLLVSLIAFDADTCAVLSKLGKGDACSVTGRASLRSWTGRDGAEKTGLSVVVERAMSAYQVRVRRKAMEAQEDVM